MKNIIKKIIKNIKSYWLIFIKKSSQVYDWIWETIKKINWEIILKISENIIIGLIIILCILTALQFRKVDIPLKLFIIQSGSMQPKISTGSLIFSFETNDYHVGDIVSYSKTEKAVITHRIIDQNENGEFITKGDANGNQDSQPILKENIVGKYIFGIPLIGYLINFAKTFQGLTILIIVPGTIIIYEEIKSLIKDIKLNFSK